MGQLVDCTAEFSIRHQYNRLNRILYNQGYGNQVVLVTYPNEESSTGIGFALYDKASKATRPLDTDLYEPLIPKNEHGQ
jgi:hypothetical protein